MSNKKAVREDAVEADRVGLFIDYETLRFGLDDAYGYGDDNTEIVGHLRDVAEQHGRVIIANAYGDWTMIKVGKHYHLFCDFDSADHSKSMRMGGKQQILTA